MLRSQRLRNEVMKNIMMENAFPSLADVLSVCCSQDPEDKFPDLEEIPFSDMDLTNLDECSEDEIKSLTANDFLNPDVFQRREGDLASGNNAIWTLTQPDDLLVPPMWTQVSEDVPNDVMFEVEICSEEKTMLDLDGTSHPSPGSAGEFTDYGSDSGSDQSVMDLSISTGPRFPYPSLKLKQEEEYSVQETVNHFQPREEYPSSQIYHQLNGIKTEYDVKPENDVKTEYETISTKNNIPSVVTSPPHMDSGSESGGDDSDESNNNNGKTSDRKRPGRKKGQVSKVYHLWEFIRDMLADPQYCPRVIKWENREEGIFRVVQSEQMAAMWGRRKNNRTKMTYEKMSRSIRYSRKEGYFADIPKDRGYPKKLCFKFGEKSHGWDLAKSHRS